MIRDQSYNLVLLGTGKYTKVYCMEVDSNRKVAVKVLKPELEKNKFFQDLLLKEGRLGQQLQHPNVRKVIEIIQNDEDGSYQLMLEYIDGYNMEQYIQNFGSIPESQIIQWCKKILPALIEAHKKGIVHGLINPANLIITPRGDLKICDFKGSLFESELFPENVDAEDILYMSPEQIQHMGSVTSSSDIYSFGVTLFSLLTGRDPYKVQNSEIDEVRLRILNDPLPFIDTCSIKMNEVIQTATAKNPLDRFASFVTMLEDITGEKMAITDFSLGAVAIEVPTKKVDDERVINTPSTSVPDSLEKTDKDIVSDEVTKIDETLKVSDEESLLERMQADIQDEVPVKSTDVETKTADFDPQSESKKIKQDHTFVKSAPIELEDVLPEEKEVDQADLDERVRKIWARVEEVSQDKPEPVVDIVPIVTSSEVKWGKEGDSKKKNHVHTKKEESPQDKTVQKTPVTDSSKEKIAIEKPLTTLPLDPPSTVKEAEKLDEPITSAPEKDKGSKIISVPPNPIASKEKLVSIPLPPKVGTADITITPAGGKSMKAWPWILGLSLLILSAVVYWYYRNSNTPSILTTPQISVSNDSSAAKEIKDTGDQFQNIPTVNLDSIAEADTSINSLNELEEAQRAQQRKFLEIRMKQEAERKQKLAEQEELKKVDPAKIEILGGYINNLAPFKFNNLIGFISKEGKIVITPKYEDILSFSSGLAPVKYKGLWGFVDAAGKERIKPQYEEIFGFSKGLAGVKQKGKWGFINTSGQIITPLKYDIVTDYSTGLAGVRRGGLWGFVNIAGKEVINCEYNNAWSFNDGLAGVEKNGNWGFISKTGQIVVPLKYDQVNNFANGMACAEKNGKFGYIDRNGTEVIEFNYDAAKPFNGNTARVFLNGKWIFINKSGKCVRNCN